MSTWLPGGMRWPWKSQTARDGLGGTPVSTLRTGRASDATLRYDRRCRQETRKPETVRALPEYNNIESSKYTAQEGGALHRLGEGRRYAGLAAIDWAAGNERSPIQGSGTA